jgi:hypothetical protein
MYMLIEMMRNFRGRHWWMMQTYKSRNEYRGTYIRSDVGLKSTVHTSGTLHEWYEVTLNCRLTWSVVDRLNFGQDLHSRRRWWKVFGPKIYTSIIPGNSYASLLHHFSKPDSRSHASISYSLLINIRKWRSIINYIRKEKTQTFHKVTGIWEIIWGGGRYMQVINCLEIRWKSVDWSFCDVKQMPYTLLVKYHSTNNFCHLISEHQGQHPVQ